MPADDPSSQPPGQSTGGDGGDSGGLPESDPRFPSGPWTGIYQQWGAQSRQRLMLHFKAGRITGSGRDPAGQFSVRGTYDTATGAARLAKFYGSYIVEYDGASDSDGIEGRWIIRYELGHADSGRFHIWPDAEAVGEANHAEAAVPVDAAH